MEGSKADLTEMKNCYRSAVQHRYLIASVETRISTDRLAEFAQKEMCIAVECSTAGREKSD